MPIVDKLRRGATDLLTERGRQSLLQRLAGRLTAQLPPSLEHNHVKASDVLAAGTSLTSATPRKKEIPLKVGWIVSPPSAGSGGHTTAFRMLEALEKAGHTCEIVLYDLFGGSVDARREVIRSAWPQLKADVRSLDDGLEGLDACVATGWQTAYALAARSAGLDLHRFYFIQDFEPFFYPRGYEYALAEATYELEMNRIALGEMVSGHVRDHRGDCFTVPFGCDRDTYRLIGDTARDGVVFYSRAGTARRGFLLATAGLAQFHRRRPKVPIKVFGPRDKTGFDFPVSWQGLQTPAQLNALYNSCLAGLGMSFTNVSLVVGEMLRAGCVPVVNDSSDARLDAPSPYIEWVNTTPVAIADALVELVDNPPADLAAISDSANSDWSQTQAEFVEIVQARCYAERAETSR